MSFKTNKNLKETNLITASLRVLLYSWKTEYVNVLLSQISRFNVAINTVVRI